MKSLHADFNRPVHCIMGLPFDAITLADAVAKVRSAAFERKPCFISTPNLNFLMAAQSNAAFRRSVLRSDLSLPDGMPIVWMARLMNIPIKERVAGADLFDALRKCGGRKLKVYFFGGPPGVAERAMQVLNAEDGGIECVGFETPGFGPVTEMSSPETLAKINRSGAEFLVVSLGAVKGQAWIEHNLEALQVPVVSHLGAVVNFVAGSVQRAPKWMQVSGFEWVWRIVEEPGLLSRYANDLKGIAVVSVKFVKEKIYKRKSVEKVIELANTAPIQIIREPNELTIKIHSLLGRLDLSLIKSELQRMTIHDLDIKLEVSDANENEDELFGLLSLLAGQQISRKKKMKICGSLKIEKMFSVS